MLPISGAERFWGVRLGMLFAPYSTFGRPQGRIEYAIGEKWKRDSRDHPACLREGCAELASPWLAAPDLFDKGHNCERSQTLGASDPDWLSTVSTEPTPARRPHGKRVARLWDLVRTL